MTRRTSLISARAAAQALEAQVANESDELTDLSDLEMNNKTANTSQDTEVDSQAEESEAESVEEPLPKKKSKKGAAAAPASKRTAVKRQKKSNDDYVAESDSDFNSATERKKTKGKAQSKRSRVPKIDWTGGRRPFDTLGDELMMTIFAQLTPGKKSTHAWNLVSKRFHAIASLPYARANWLLTHYSRANALYHCVRIGSICEEETLNSLIDGGRACSSRYFFQMACLAYSKKTPAYLSKKWCSSETISFANWIALLTKGVELFPTLSPSTGKDDAEIIRSWIRSKGTQTTIATTRQRRFRRWRGNNADEVQTFESKDKETEAKDKEFQAITDLFETQKFCPFSDKDPLIGEFIDAININPNFMDVALSAGFEVNDAFQTLAFEKIFFKSATNDSKLEEFQKLFGICPELAPEKSAFEALLTKKPAKNGRDSDKALMHSHIELLQAFDASSLVDFSLTEPCAAAVEIKGKQLKAFELRAEAGLIYSMVETLGLGSNTIDVEIAAKVLFFLAQDAPAIRDYFDVSSESLAHTVQAECQRIARLVDSDTAIKALEDWNLSGEVDDDLLLRLIVDEPVNISAIHAYLNTKHTPEEVEQVMVKAAVALLWRPHQGKALGTIISLVPGCKDRVASVLVNEFSFSRDALRQAKKNNTLTTLVTPFSIPRELSNGVVFSTGVYESLRPDVTPSEEFLCKSRCLVPVVRTSVATVLQSRFRSVAGVQQLLFNHASLTNNAALINSTIDAEAVVTMEVFHLHAALRSGVGAKIIGIVQQGLATFYKSPDDFQAPASAGKPSVATRIKRLDKWISSITDLLEDEREASKSSKVPNVFVDTTTVQLGMAKRIVQYWKAQKPGACPEAAFSSGWCRSCGSVHRDGEEIEEVGYDYGLDSDEYY